MAKNDTGPSQPDPLRRGLLLGGGVAAGMALTRAAVAQQVETDTGPKTLDNQPMPDLHPNGRPVRYGRTAAPC